MVNAILNKIICIYIIVFNAAENIKCLRLHLTMCVVENIWIYCKYDDKRLQRLSRLVGGEHRQNFTMHKRGW